MKYLLIGITLTVSMSAIGAEIAWDWPYEDARVTHFRVEADGTEIARTPDAAARQVSVELIGGETLTAFACSEQTCSPPSNPLWIPQGVQNIRITWGLQ